MEDIAGEIFDKTIEAINSKFPGLPLDCGLTAAALLSVLTMHEASKGRSLSMGEIQDDFIWVLGQIEAQE